MALQPAICVETGSKSQGNQSIGVFSDSEGRKRESMTELKAVEQCLGEWRKRARGEKVVSYGCPLCKYVGNLSRRSAAVSCESSCPVYKGAVKDCGTFGEPYSDWTGASSREEERQCAHRCVALLERARDRILAEAKA